MMMLSTETNNKCLNQLKESSNRKISNKLLTIDLKEEKTGRNPSGMKTVTKSQGK